jgi:dihydrofolate reductase
MRKLVWFIHTSLDGFAVATNKELDWAHVDEEIFEYAGDQTDQADTALYGRVTYGIMNAYWPTAGDQPNASKHDKQHASWYKKVQKVVLSKTMQETGLPDTTIIGDNVSEEILTLKQAPGKNIIVFGSPTVAHFLMAEDLIDDYWLFVNPILLGEGIPVFKDIRERRKLKLVTGNIFSSGVVGVHYERVVKS